MKEPTVVRLDETERPPRRIVAYKDGIPSDARGYRVIDR